MGDTELREVFMTEVTEILVNLETDVVNLEESSQDEEVLNRIFRYFHTIKGSSGIAGFTTVYEFTHFLENLLDDLRSHSIEVTDEVIDVIFNGIDWIKDEIFTDVVPSESTDKKDLILSKIELIKGEKIESKEALDLEPVKNDNSGKKYYRIRASFVENIFEYGIDPLMIIEDLMLHGREVTKKIDKSTLPDIESFDPEKCYFKWDIIFETEESIEKINDVFIFVKDDNDIRIDDITSEYINDERQNSPIQEKKIGEILIDSGVISEDNLEEAITIQEKQNKKLGDIIVKKGFASANDVNSAISEQNKLKKSLEVQTVRVDTGKLDNLLNLLGEIVIGQSALTRIAEEIDEDVSYQLKNALYALDRTTREFQEQIMAIRMIPIGPTFDGFKRFVRDISHNLGKEIKLNIEGAETELDKTVIEKIADPLKHMIRNSIDHGIETVEVRDKAGKRGTGEITLKAYHQEGSVYIEIKDDGKGLNVERIRKKAIEMDLLEEDEEIADEKLFQFLFYPGFSTAESIGDLSGRGVGMDVVKTNIEDLRGNVEIKSTEGIGTIIKIKLPLTLAIIDCFIVTIGKSIYIIPLLSVVESYRPEKEDVKTIEGKGEVLYVRGEYISLYRLYEIFDVEPVHTNPWEALVVIVEAGNERVGLLIDDLLGQQQIVIKSLDNFITDSRAVSGAAILGDGKVALIIDIFGLMDEMKK